MKLVEYLSAAMSILFYSAAMFAAVNQEWITLAFALGTSAWWAEWWVKAQWNLILIIKEPESNV